MVRADKLPLKKISGPSISKNWRRWKVFVTSADGQFKIYKTPIVHMFTGVRKVEYYSLRMNKPVFLSLS